MSITIGNMPVYSPISRSFAAQSKGSDFRKRVSSEISSLSKPVRELNCFDPTPLLKDKGKSSIALGSNVAMDYAMWYAEGSTEENPVIFARTIDANGREMEQTFSLNDIDPHNATYLEMLALQVHYKPDEEICHFSQGSYLGPTDRMDFVDGYKQLISKHLINHFYDDASRCQKMLDFYMDIFEKNRSKDRDKEWQLKALTASIYTRSLRMM